MPLKKSLQLLHIDDSSILRKTVSRGLEPFKEYYELTQVGSADEALELLASGKKIDVILTDWLMNGKSGFTLLCMLKSHPAYHHLPVFFLTSEYESSSLISAVTFGASGILKKPTSGPDIHAYLQKKAVVIEESFQQNADSFISEAKEVLKSLHQALPLKNVQDLTTCLHHVQNIRAKAAPAKWPLLAEYSQRIDDTIQATLKKEMAMLAPMNAIMKEYYSYMTQCLTDLENGRPHAFVSDDIERNLKNYHTSLEAGWFADKTSDDQSDGLLLPWDVITELRRHLTPEGLLLLEQYSNEKKAS